MEILKIVADNPALIDALKELLRAEFKTPIEDADNLSDELLGQRTRARLYGKRAIESAFQKLGKYRTPQEGKERGGPPR